MSKQALLQPGKNCWRLGKADRLAFLVDGADYFKALYAVLEQAERSIFIVGWDVNSRLRLIRDPGSGDTSPLGDYLSRIIARRRDLHVHVLTWDFASIYGLEREWLPIFGLGWPSHRRLHFHMDDQHPTGGSQHQKVVVVDDALAFVGGLDLTKGRWDTSAHSPENPLRMDPDGNFYPPFHDVQMMVSGEAASALGALARERWLRATGRRLPPPSPDHYHPWPSFVQPDIRSVEIAIARTLPVYAGRAEVREVEQLYVDMIAQAQSCIYIENQYFSSRAVAEAVAARLTDPDGPEIILISPLRTDGWLAQHTMDVVRDRMLKTMQLADRQGRFRAYYPHVPGLGDRNINVHAKVMVVDEGIVRVGSSNLSNRSMGLDSECDLAVAVSAERVDVRQAIAGFRNRLLGEHLGVEAQQVAAVSSREGSLIKAIESLRGQGRTLMELTPRTSPQLDGWVPESEMLDPEQPLDPDRLLDHFIPPEEKKTVAARFAILASALGLLFVLTVVWRWTPLGDWLDVGRVFQKVMVLKENPLAPFWILGSYLLGGLIAVPVSLLIIVTILGFGPVTGGLYALVGSLLSAALTYGIGQMMGRKAVRRFGGRRLNRLSRRLARRGLLAVVFVRAVPVAPFSVVNMVAGASHIRFQDFMLGTFLGMAPGIVAAAVLTDRVSSVVRSPEWIDLLELSLAFGIIILGMLGLSYWLRRAQNLK